MFEVRIILLCLPSILLATTLEPGKTRIIYLYQLNKKYEKLSEATRTKNKTETNKQIENSKGKRRRKKKTETKNTK